MFFSQSNSPSGTNRKLWLLGWLTERCFFCCCVLFSRLCPCLKVKWFWCMVCVGRLGLSSKELEFKCDYIIFNILALFKHILIFNKGPSGVSIKSMILEQRGCRIVKEYCTIRLTSSWETITIIDGKSNVHFQQKTWCKTRFVVETKLSLTNAAQCNLKAFLKSDKRKFSDASAHYVAFVKCCLNKVQPEISLCTSMHYDTLVNNKLNFTGDWIKKDYFICKSNAYDG